MAKTGIPKQFFARGDYLTSKSWKWGGAPVIKVARGTHGNSVVIKQSRDLFC